MYFLFPSFQYFHHQMKISAAMGITNILKNTVFQHWIVSVAKVMKGPIVKVLNGSATAIKC